MATLEVRGAQGRAGRAAVARLEALGHDVAAERDGAGVMLVDLTPPNEARRERWAAAAQSGRHVLSASLSPADVRWAQADWGQAAVERGIVLAPTVGAAAVLGDLLGAIAASASGEADEIHLAHLVVERGGVLAHASPGLRAELAALVGTRAVVHVAGELVLEPVAERRRLAWFARPVGPHHAASIPAPEVVTLPWHQPTVSLVDGHVAMTSWRAEMLQALGNLSAANASVATSLRARVARPVRRPRTVDGDGARWTTVAEASGTIGVARAWANGRDLQRLTGEVVAHLADQILRTGARGVLAPAQMTAPGDLLDTLTAATDLRWAVVRPSQD